MSCSWRVKRLPSTSTSWPRLVLDRSEVASDFDYEVFRSHIAGRFEMIEPLRRRLLRTPLAHPAWIDDADIHLDRHLHHIVLPDGGGLNALAGVAADIASFPLPSDRPPWEAWFVEGVSKDDVAVIAKIHHSAADGVSGIFALAAFFDLEPSPATSPGPPSWQPSPAPGFAELGRAALGNLWHRPEAVVRSIRQVGISAMDMVRSRAHTPLPFTGPRQSYNRALTPRRAVAFATIRLDDIEADPARVRGIGQRRPGGGLRRYPASLLAPSWRTADPAPRGRCSRLGAQTGARFVRQPDLVHALLPPGRM